MKGNIKLAVSLYSFGEPFYTQPSFGFADMFEILKKLDINRFEIVGEQMFDNVPIPSNEKIRELLDACDRYGMAPLSYGGGIDMGKYTGRDMTDEEMFRDAVCDIRTAKLLGCQFLRSGKIPLKFYERYVEILEKYGITAGIEIHSPSKPSDANIQEMCAEMDRIGSKRLGFVPDFGCYIEKPSPRSIDRYLAQGAHKEILDYIIANRHSGMTEAEMTEVVTGMGASTADLLALSAFFGFMTFGPADIDGLKSVLHNAVYFHGKFYEVTEELYETTIPYDKLIKAIDDSGFDGYIMTEYEGGANSLVQVPRHLAMERKILASL